MKGQGSFRCIPVINDVTEQQFPEESLDFLDNDFDYNPIFTSIWRNPERLSINSDYSLLLAALSSEILRGNYAETLKICREIRKSKSEVERITQIFEILLMQMLKSNADPHMLLHWLSIGDTDFGCSKFTKESYAILKIYCLARIRKTNLECFPHGCVQKTSIELYRKDSSKRLMGGLHSLIKGSFKLEPTLKRLFLGLPRISPLEFFEFYCDLLDELQNCKAIDDSDKEKRLVQLIGILCELRSEDVLKACSNLNKIIGSRVTDRKKPPPLIERVLLRLCSKIFDCLSQSNLKFDKIHVEKVVDLVVKEKNGQGAALKPGEVIWLPPMQLLNRILSEYDAWGKVWTGLESRLASVQIGSQHGPIVVIYFLCLIIRNDPSQISILITHLEQQYSKEDTKSKNVILFLIQIMERIPQIQDNFKNNSIRKRLLLNSDFEIVIHFLHEFSGSELNQFLQHSSFSDDHFQILKEKLKGNTEISIESDAFWMCILENCDENSIIFIERQLKILEKRRDTRKFEFRIDQIFKKTFDCKALNPVLVLKFPKILLSQWEFLSERSRTSLARLLILTFSSSIFEDNQTEVTQNFRDFGRRLKPESVNEPNLEIFQIIQEMCLQIKKTCLNQSINALKEILRIGFLKKLFDSDTLASRKERIVQISSIFLMILSPELQKIGDTNGKAKFCQLLTIIDSFIKTSTKNEIIPNFEYFEKICEQTMEGLSAYEDKKWNWLFLKRKIQDILTAAKKDVTLLGRLIRIVNKNESLRSKLTTDFKEFSQLASSIS